MQNYAKETKSHKAKLWISGILVLLSLIVIIVRFGLMEAVFYSILTEALVALAWTFCVIIVVYEQSRDLSHNWVLKFWWIAAFIISAVTLQTLSNQWEKRDFQWFDVFDIIKLVLYGVIAALGCFFENTKDRFKENVEKEGYVKLIDERKSTVGYGSLNTVENERFLARERISPEETANIFSKATFWWTGGLLKLGWERALEQEDLWPLVRQDQSSFISNTFEREWEQQQQLAKPSLAKVLIKQFGLVFLLAGILKLGNDVLTFSGPLLLNLIVRFVQNPSWPFHYGLLMALAMFLSGVLQTLFVQFYFHLVFRVGQRVRSAIVTTVYKKAFKISSKARQKFSTGEIVNHMSIDANRLNGLVPYLHMIWSAPLQIGVSLYLLYTQVGPAVFAGSLSPLHLVFFYLSTLQFFLKNGTFAGIGVMILMIPINAILIKKMIAYQKVMMANKDKRVKIMNEVLQGIRIIKFFAWENSYLNKVNEIRDFELKTLRSSSYLSAVKKKSLLHFLFTSFSFFFPSPLPHSSSFLFTSLFLPPPHFSSFLPLPLSLLHVPSQNREK